MKIRTEVVLPQECHSTVLCKLQLGRPSDLLLKNFPRAPEFRVGDEFLLVAEYVYKKGKRSSYTDRRHYPVQVEGLTSHRMCVSSLYCFGIQEALQMMQDAACMRRRCWSETFDIRWIPNDLRSIFWYNTGDGYLPYTLREEDLAASDWGVKVGYRTELPPAEWNHL